MDLEALVDKPADIKLRQLTTAGVKAPHVMRLTLTHARRQYILLGVSA